MDYYEDTQSYGILLYLENPVLPNHLFKVIPNNV